MEPLTEGDIRTAFRDCSRGERESMHLPDLSEVPWEELDFLGWRDPKAPQRGYVVRSNGNGVTAITLRAPEQPVRRAAQCLLCHTVQQDGVALFTARRAGSAGRNGSSVGTYICSDLACSRHLRHALRPSPQLPDPEPVLRARTGEMLQRLDGFLAGVLRE